jgi:diguanylate cyclase (GGDEF)-like protein/PAS domain S-box-containing protein
MMSSVSVLITPGVLPVTDVSSVQQLLDEVPVFASESIRAAVHELDRMALESPPNSSVAIVLALEDLGKEPGSVQSHLAQHQQQQRLIVIATYSGEQASSSLIYPIRIDVLTKSDIKPAELAQHLIDEVNRYQRRTALGRADEVLGGIGAPVLVISLQGNTTWANALAADLFGQSPDQLIGKHLPDLLAIEPQSRAAQRIERQIRMLRSDMSAELGEFVLARGKQRLRLSCIAKRMPTGDSDEIVLLLRDTSAQYERYAEYLLSAKVFEHSGEAIMITDHEDRILKVNEGFTQLTGYACSEVIGQLPTFLNAGRELAAFYDTLWNQVHADGHWNGELWHRRKNGEPYAAWCAISAVRDAEGEVDHYVSIFTDVTERKMRDEHRLYQSQLDMLTGLPNRVLLADRFNQIVARHARQPVGIALLFIDLDGFKPINDNHGHHVGDELLRVVADRLRASVRASDTVSRYGGDEFVCLLDDLEDIDAPQKVAATILAALNAPVSVAGHTLSISASIGISVFRGSTPDLSFMMSRADDAMYHAKRAGRGRWHVATESTC